MRYFVYILQSRKNNSFYKGSTDNLSRRFSEHNRGSEPATRKYLPWDLVWFTAKPNRSEAYRLEMKLKNLSVERTIEFINIQPNKLSGALTWRLCASQDADRKRQHSIPSVTTG